MNKPSIYGENVMKETKSEVEIRAKTIGKYLKEKRVACGMTQSAVADELKYKSAQFISNWERGLALPPINVLPHLVTLYGIQPVELIETLHVYQEQILRLTRNKLLAALKVETRIR